MKRLWLVYFTVFYWTVHATTIMEPPVKPEQPLLCRLAMACRFVSFFTEVVMRFVDHD
jgi:hypothetical protein